MTASFMYAKLGWFKICLRDTLILKITLVYTFSVLQLLSWLWRNSMGVAIHFVIVELRVITVFKSSCHVYISYRCMCDNW